MTSFAGNCSGPSINLIITRVLLPRGKAMSPDMTIHVPVVGGEGGTSPWSLLKHLIRANGVGIPCFPLFAGDFWALPG